MSDSPMRKQTAGGRRLAMAFVKDHRAEQGTLSTRPGSSLPGINEVAGSRPGPAGSVPRDGPAQMGPEDFSPPIGRGLGGVRKKTGGRVLAHRRGRSGLKTRQAVGTFARGLHSPQWGPRSSKPTLRSMVTGRGVVCPKTDLFYCATVKRPSDFGPKRALWAVIKANGIKGVESKPHRESLSLRGSAGKSTQIIFGNWRVWGGGGGGGGGGYFVTVRVKSRAMARIHLRL